MKLPEYFVHDSAFADDGCQVGSGTRIWHFSHVMAGAQIGSGCNLGQNVFVAGGVRVGDNVKIQNNVSLYQGTIVEDDVFIGPSAVLTNVSNPRAQVGRRALYEETRLRRGCTVGANATVVCGVTLGRYAFVAAGSVVTKNIADYSLVVGVPGRPAGWMSRHGHRLHPSKDGTCRCPESGLRYELREGRLLCLDLDESAPLPPELVLGTRRYRELQPPRRAGTDDD